MFVPSMTMDELRKEYEKDEEIVSRKAGYVLDKIQKDGKLHGQQRIVQFLDYHSKYHNNWLFRFQAGKHEKLWTQLTWFQGKKGLVALSKVFQNKVPYMVYFTGHMFERYCERSHLPFYSPKEMLRSFMNENNAFQIQYMEEYAPHFWEVFCVTSSGGIILGTADGANSTYRFNTYLSPDMLRKEQTALRAQLQENFLAYRGLNTD